MVFGQLLQGAKNFFGNAASSVGNFFGNAANTIKDTVKKNFDRLGSDGAFLAPGGYNYCGPGNPLQNGQPKNGTDAACRVHDYEYSAFAKNKDKLSPDDLKRMVRESDHKLIDAINRSGDNDIGSWGSKALIHGKMKLEDWGILNHNLFVNE